MVWSHYLPKKSLLVVGGGGGDEWQTKFNVSPGPGLWSFILGPFGPDLGPDLDLTWDLDLDLSLTKTNRLCHSLNKLCINQLIITNLILVFHLPLEQ